MTSAPRRILPGLLLAVGLGSLAALGLAVGPGPLRSGRLGALRAPGLGPRALDLGPRALGLALGPAAPSGHPLAAPPFQQVTRFVAALPADGGWFAVDVRPFHGLIEHLQRRQALGLGESADGAAGDEPRPAPLRAGRPVLEAAIDRALRCHVDEGDAGDATSGVARAAGAQAALWGDERVLADALLGSLTAAECPADEAACAARIQALPCADLARRLSVVWRGAAWAETYTAALRDRVLGCAAAEVAAPGAPDRPARPEQIERFRAGLSRALTALAAEGVCQVVPALAAVCAEALPRRSCAQLAAGLAVDPRQMLRRTIVDCAGLLDCGDVAR